LKGVAGKRNRVIKKPGNFIDDDFARILFCKSSGAPRRDPDGQ